MPLLYKGKRQYKSTSGSVHTGAEISTLTYTASTTVLGKIEFTINGSTKYVTEWSVQNCTNTIACILQIQGNNSGLEGSNTISVKLTPTSTNYNDKTVNVTGSAVPTYWIKYNMNGGTGTIADQIKVKGTNLTLSSIVPTREGFAFQGWATSSTATSPTYAKGGTYTANAGATLYAVWKDSQAPTLALDKWTYHAGWGSNGPLYGYNIISSVDNGTQWRIGSTTGGIIPRFYTVNGGRYYVTFDYYGTTAAPAVTPKDGWFTNMFYQDFYANAMADTHSDYNYTSNGHAGAHPLNTWEFDTSLSEGLSIYGFDRVRFGVEADNYYGVGHLYVKNLRVWGDNMRNSFYEIHATLDDNVGISAVKYISGSKTADDCISNGTAMNLNGNYYWSQVTNNGTYTVCVSDLAGNITSKTITINKIGKLTPLYPYMYNDTPYYSNLCWTYDGYNQTCEPRVYVEENNTQSSYQVVGENVENIFGYYYYEFDEATYSGGRMFNIGNDITPSPYGQTQASGAFRSLSKVQVGSNTFTLTEKVGSNNWIVIHFAGGHSTPNFNISNIKLHFDDGRSYNIQTSSAYHYISDFTIASGGGYGGNLDTSNLFTGGTVTGSWPYIDVFIKVLDKSYLNAISFDTTSGLTGTADGIRIIKFPSTFDFSLAPFSSKYWYDNWSNTLYADGTTPTTVYDAIYATAIANARVFIQTDDSGHHRTCIRSVMKNTVTDDSMFCIGRNYWDTDAETTRIKLFKDMQKAFNVAPGTWTNGTTSSSAQPRGVSSDKGLYDCGANAAGDVTCSYKMSNGDWSDSSLWHSCSVYADGRAACYTGH